MSRRSLRLHTGLGPAPYGDSSFLDASLPLASASFSVGGPNRRNTTGLKSRRSQQHSVSCSQSLLNQPHTPRKQTGQSLHSSSLHSVASDASLLSSMLEESHIQEQTLTDSLWGLDHDADLNETTIRGHNSSVLTCNTMLNSTMVSNGEDHHPSDHAQNQASSANGHYYQESVILSSRKEALTTYSSAKYSSSSLSGMTETGHRGAAEQDLTSSRVVSPPSTIYSREKSHRSKTGHVASVRDAGVSVCKGTAASVTYLLTLLYHNVLLRTRQTGKGVWQSVLATGLLYCSRAAAFSVSALTGLLQASRAAVLSRSARRKTTADIGTEKVSNGAHSSYCRGMNTQELGDSNGRLNLTGSLWKAVGRVSRWLGRGWCHMTSFMSLLKALLLQQCLPKLLHLLFILLPLLLFFSLWRWGLPSVLSVLPAVNVTSWGSALHVSSLPSLSFLYTFIPAHSQATDRPLEDSADAQTYSELPFIPLPPPGAQTGSEDGAAASVDSERLVRLEHSLSQLWERVEGGRLRLEQRHGEVMGLYQALEQQSARDREAMQPWVNSLLEQRLATLTTHMEEEKTHRDQTQQQYLTQQQNQASHLAQLEVLVQALAAKTEEIQRRQEASTPATTPATTLPAPVSVGVDRESHNALLAEVARLETTLGSVRQDLQGLMGLRDTCERLDGIQNTISGQVSAQVSAQVREEIRALFYGNQLVAAGAVPDGPGDPADLPDSLLQWLAERYVSGADLQAALASLELSILQNVSQQLEQHSRDQTPPSDTVSETVAHTMEAAGAAVTEEQVQLIVRNALKLYSQDQTGLADFALESGGGSILSTRCSETYQTKTALLSLFGLPLWYLSKSPRVVIQPDVHPGNCWAFRGSQGYLVIRLSMRIRPTAFTLEHIPKSLAPSGTLRSAPRDFIVYGLDDERQDQGKFLGNYTYEEDGEAVQTFPVFGEKDRMFQIIEVQIQSNWGHEEYTCIYRFRVHGLPGSS